MFFKIESWNLFSASVWKRISWNLTKFQLIQLIQTIVIFIFSIGCLIELKFCEVSRNSFSNRCWKFQLSILKNKKVLFLKKYFLSRCQYQNKKNFVYWPNFQWRFWGNHAKVAKNKHGTFAKHGLISIEDPALHLPLNFYEI